MRNDNSGEPGPLERAGARDRLAQEDFEMTEWSSSRHLGGWSDQKQCGSGFIP